MMDHEICKKNQNKDEILIKVWNGDPLVDSLLVLALMLLKNHNIPYRLQKVKYHNSPDLPQIITNGCRISRGPHFIPFVYQLCRYNELPLLEQKFKDETDPNFYTFTTEFVEPLVIAFSYECWLLQNNEISNTKPFFIKLMGEKIGSGYCNKTLNMWKDFFSQKYEQDPNYLSNMNGQTSQFYSTVLWLSLYFCYQYKRAIKLCLKIVMFVHLSGTGLMIQTKLFYGGVKWFIPIPTNVSSWLILAQKTTKLFETCKFGVLSAERILANKHPFISGESLMRPDLIITSILIVIFNFQLTHSDLHALFINKPHLVAYVTRVYEYFFHDIVEEFRKAELREDENDHGELNSRFKIFYIKYKNIIVMFVTGFKHYSNITYHFIKTSFVPVFQALLHMFRYHLQRFSPDVLIFGFCITTIFILYLLLLRFN